MSDRGESRDHQLTLYLHLVGAALQAGGIALSFVLPFLARKRFEADNLQMFLMTAAVPIMQFFTIFWNHAYARLSSGQYLMLIGALGATPIALLSLTADMDLLLVGYAVAAFAGFGGGAALSPVNADLLRTCYDQRVRGRVLGRVSSAQFLGVIVTGLTTGFWSDRNPDAYRTFLPIVALLFATGLMMFYRISQSSIFQSRERLQVAGDEKWWEPLRHMGEILREDRTFRNYETAFMSYGVGWMICTALVPVLAEDKLGLDYSVFAWSTFVVQQAIMMVLLIPAGRLADRIGPVRLAAGSFIWLTIYPVGLLFAPSGNWLALCSALYAIGMVGVHLTWTLGPVSFAPDASKAPSYLAVHGTLVGVRGIVFQGIGVGLYTLTGEFLVPLLMASAGFALASIWMRRVT